MNKKYVHGYSPRESQRLREQSLVIEDLLHGDTGYAAGSLVLEAGCGVGAQTAILAGRSPQAEITSIDTSEKSLQEAQDLINSLGIKNVKFMKSDIMEMTFTGDSFDHVFVCFVLEHLDDPLKALVRLRTVLKPGGSITVIEGDHGSFFWHPETTESKKVWQCLITLQKGLGHDPLIGRKLFPLLSGAGFQVQNVTPRWIYGDDNLSELKSDGAHKILIPMLQASRNQALELKLIDEKTWEKGIDDIGLAAKTREGTFFYTWFKAVAYKPIGG
ncbi:MAG: methyltransferase domain-containing protein [Dehalococcoidales bacterium]|nr:methyltransferase domain-containing protein [Dehalococcoidales bacterium]